MNLFWGAKFDHGMLLCDVPREWVQVCGWDNAQRKQMPDHKEVEQSGSGKNRAPKAWFCQCWSIRDTTPHPMGNRSCCWFCRTMSFVYPLVAQKSFFGRLYDLSFLEHVCMKFRTRTDWWNSGLILFFFSCPRWGLTLIWKPKHLQKLTIVIYDLKRMRTWEDETNCWWLSAFFWSLDWTATAIIDALSAQQNFADNPPCGNPWWIQGVI